MNEGDKANKRRGIEIKDNMWRRKTRKKKEKRMDDMKVGKRGNNMMNKEF